jgi:DtxR family transcriptional regulator, Mn-dependent transcriptional regulator
MTSPTIENYLKAIFNLHIVKEEINTTDIANALGVSLPTVNSMVKKLDELGLVEYEKYRPIRITDKGKREAALILRKHRLTEIYLVERMGFGWEEVHDVAEQVEHINSPVFFDRIDELLGYPKFDPHGSPIPDKDGRIPVRNLRKLKDCVEGQTVTLTALGDSSRDFLKYLNEKALKLGTQLQIKKVEPFDGSMYINYGSDMAISLSSGICDKLLVRQSQ